MEEPQRADHHHPQPRSSASCPPQRPLQPPTATTPNTGRGGWRRRPSSLPAKGSAATWRGGRVALVTDWSGSPCDSPTISISTTAACGGVSTTATCGGGGRRCYCRWWGGRRRSWGGRKGTAADSIARCGGEGVVTAVAEREREHLHLHHRCSR